MPSTPTWPTPSAITPANGPKPIAATKMIAQTSDGIARITFRIIREVLVDDRVRRGVARPPAARTGTTGPRPGWCRGTPSGPSPGSGRASSASRRCPAARGSRRTRTMLRPEALELLRADLDADDGPDDQGRKTSASRIVSGRGHRDRAEQRLPLLVGRECGAGRRCGGHGSLQPLRRLDRLRARRERGARCSEAVGWRVRP